MADRMCLRDSPPPFSPGVIGMNTLVAMTTSSRLNILGQQPPRGHLAGALRVGVGGVEEGDAAFDRGPDDRLGLLLVEHPRPVAVVAEAHHPEADPRPAHRSCRGSRTPWIPPVVNGRIGPRASVGDRPWRARPRTELDRTGRAWAGRPPRRAPGSRCGCAGRLPGSGADSGPDRFREDRRRPSGLDKRVASASQETHR